VGDESRREFDDSPERRGRQEKDEGQPQFVSEQRRSIGFDKEKYGRRCGENNKTTARFYESTC
jgi:hypothetical protein